MSSSLPEVRADREAAVTRVQTLQEEVQSINDRADGRELTDGERQRIERLTHGIARATATIEQADDDARAYILRLGQRAENTERIGQGSEDERVTGRHVSPAGHESRALRAIEARSRHLPGDHADRLDRIARSEAKGARYLAAVAAPAYNRAFGKLLQHGPYAHVQMSPDEIAAVQEVTQADAERAMSLAGASGGFAVPFDLDPTLVPTSAGVTNPLRDLARVVQTTSDTWRGVTSGAVTATYEAELTETTDNSPTLAQPEISTEKAQAFVPFSIEIGQDWPSMQRELTGLLQDAKDTLEASKFLSGTGTNEPFGLLTGVTNTVNAAAGADTFSVDNVYALVNALPARYQPNAKFLASGTILNRIYRLTPSGSTTEPQLMNPDRGSILGKPVVEMSTMPTAATTGLKFLVYGDFSRFVIVDRVGLTVELISHLFSTNHRPNGSRGLYMYFRNSSKVIDAGAFRALIGTA